MELISPLLYIYRAECGKKNGGCFLEPEEKLIISRSEFSPSGVRNCILIDVISEPWLSIPVPNVGIKRDCHSFRNIVYLRGRSCGLLRRVVW